MKEVQEFELGKWAGDPKTKKLTKELRDSSAVIKDSVEPNTVAEKASVVVDFTVSLWRFTTCFSLLKVLRSPVVNGQKHLVTCALSKASPVALDCDSHSSLPREISLSQPEKFCCVAIGSLWGFQKVKWLNLFCRNGQLPAAENGREVGKPRC